MPPEPRASDAGDDEDWPELFTPIARFRSAVSIEDRLVAMVVTDAQGAEVAVCLTPDMAEAIAGELLENARHARKRDS